MTIKKSRTDEREAVAPRKHRHTENHLAEKHFKNAFKSRSFSRSALTDEDLAELGFDDDEQY